MQIVGIYNIKGGVGKTAAAVNLAYLASREMPTLLCDLDPQGAASFYLQVEADSKLSKKRLLKGANKVNSSIRQTGCKGLDILPAAMSFRNLDLLLDGKKRSKKRLREILEPFGAVYDCIIIDSPPNITLLSENILNAADRVLVPVIPTSLSIMTLEKLSAFFGKKGLDREKLLPFFSMVEKRKKLHRETMNNPAQPLPFLTTPIPYCAEVEKMGIYRQPLPHKHPKSRLAANYRALWKALKSRLEFTD